MANLGVSEKATRIAVDPEGDLILELSRQDGQTHLLVSSKILSLTSPVFARMLKSPFQEGVSFRASTVAEPSIIKMHDDDAEAFTFLCYALHYRAGAAWSKLTVQKLTDLTVICSKWDFVAAVSPFAEIWLESCNWANLEDLTKCLVMAYVLDAPFAFSFFSWKVVVDSVGPPSCFLEGPLCDLVPINLQAELRLRKAELDMDLVSTIESATLDVLKCNDFAQYANLYFHLLQEHKLWPTSPQLEEQSISELLERMDLDLPTGHLFASCKPVVCLCGMLKFRDAMRKAIPELTGSERGLCLDCVIRGARPGEDERECRRCNR